MQGEDKVISVDQVKPTVANVEAPVNQTAPTLTVEVVPTTPIEEVSTPVEVLPLNENAPAVEENAPLASEQVIAPEPVLIITEPTVAPEPVISPPPEPITPSVETTAPTPLITITPSINVVPPSKTIAEVPKVESVSTVPQKVLDLSPAELDAARRLWANQNIATVQAKSARDRHEKREVLLAKIQKYAKSHSPTTLNSIAYENNISKRKASDYMRILVSSGRVQASGKTTSRTYS